MVASERLWPGSRSPVSIAEITAATSLWISLSTGLLINHIRNKLQVSGKAADTGELHGLAISLEAGPERAERDRPPGVTALSNRKSQIFQHTARKSLPHVHSCVMRYIR